MTPGAVRRDDGRDRGAARGLARPRRCCAPRARCSRTRASSRLYGQVSETEAQNAPEDEADGDDAKVRLPAIAEGDVLELREASGGGPRDAAAAALQRGLAREVHGGERHRPPLHLRRHPAQDRAARVRAQEGPPLHPDAARPPRRRPDEGGLRRLLPDRVHGADGGGARRGRGGQGRLAPGAAPTSTASSRRTASARRSRCTRSRPGDAAGARGVHGLPPDQRPRRHLPRERPPAEAAHGQERPLHRVQRLPRVHLDRRHPRDGGRPRRHVGARGTDLRRVRQPDAAAHGAERARPSSAAPRTPSAATSSTSRSRAARPEARPDEPTGEKCPRLRPRPREAARPLRRVRVLLELPELPVQAAQARDAHRRHLPRVPQGTDPRAQGPLRPLLRLRALPRVHEELPRAPGAEAVSEVRDRVPARARAQGRAFYVCETEGCDYDEPAATSTATRSPPRSPRRPARPPWSPRR